MKLASRALIILIFAPILVWADPEEATIGPIHISNVKTFAQYEVTAFAASGRSPTILTAGSSPLVNLITGRSETQMITGNQVQIPSFVYLKKARFQLANMLILIIHSSATPLPFINNPDGECPQVPVFFPNLNQGCREGFVMDHVETKFIMLSDFDKLFDPKTQIYNLDFNRDL